MEENFQAQVCIETKPVIKIVRIYLDEYFDENSKTERDIREGNTISRNEKLKFTHNYQNKRSKMWNIIAETNADAYGRIVKTRSYIYDADYIYDAEDVKYLMNNLNTCYKRSKYGQLLKYAELQKHAPSGLEIIQAETNTNCIASNTKIQN